MTDTWTPDVLDGFEQLTLPLADDNEGPVVATLVRPRKAPSFLGGVARTTDVLYVHGWSDYFFNPELAEYWRGLGARFHALDLRKYGRSLRDGQTPGFITDLATYDEDIEAALAAIGHGVGVSTRRRLVLLGHSTGGLTLSLWAARSPGRATALVLNSPWLEFQARAAGRAAIAPLIGVEARLRPLNALPQVDLGFYTRAVSKRFEGRWDYDTAWRPDHGFVVRPAWLNAILAGHGTVASGLDIDAPVLVMLSRRSVLAARWSESMLTADSVLVVDDIAVSSTKLGHTVTVLRFDDALHDIWLSDPRVVAVAEAAVARWLRAYL